MPERDETPAPSPAPTAAAASDGADAFAPAERRGGALLLLLLIAIFHGQVVHGGFVYDDSWTIVENAFLRAPGNALQLLGPGPARDGVPDAGRPTLLATEILDHALWGLDKPAGWHLQSLIEHAAVTWLLFTAVLALGRRFLLAVLAGGLFAVHPLLVEPVAAVNYREDILATLFTLGALGLVVLARSPPAPDPERRGPGGAPRVSPPDPPSRGRAFALRVAAVGSLLLGAFAKENACVAPILLVTLDLCREPGRPIAVLRRRWPDYLLLAAPVAGVFLWRWAVLGAPGIVSRTAEIPPAHLDHVRTVLHQSWVFVRGAGQIVLPLGLSPEYVEDPVGPRSLVAGLLSTVALAGAAVAVWRKRTQHPLLAMGVLGALVTWLPTAGFVAITNLRADRYFYLPAAFLLTALAYLALAGARRLRVLAGPPIIDVPRTWLAVGAVLLVFGSVTLRQSRIWRSDLALWTAGTAAAPTSARAFAALGEARLRVNRSMEALEAAQQSLRLYPSSGHTRELVGIIHMQQGHFEQAHADLEEALRLGVIDRGELLNNLGYCEMQMKRWRDALGRFAEAERLAPRYDRPSLNAARAHEALGEHDRAVAALRRAVARVPESLEGWKQLAAALEQDGDRAEASKARLRAAALGSFVGEQPTRGR